MADIVHVQRPFHVMVGGGDQVYSDEVRVSGPLKGWATHLSPRKRAKFKVTEQFGKDVDEWCVAIQSECVGYITM